MTPEECRENLVAVKKRLTEALGGVGNEKMYWANMRSWFKQRISKEEFDIEARNLLPPDVTNLHNEFLLAVLTKCHSVGASVGNKETSSQLSIKAKRNKRKMLAIKRKFDNRFVPSPSTNLLPSRNLHQENKQATYRRSQKLQESRFPKNIIFSSRSLEIPSMVEMNGRIAVITWERGLDDFVDEVSQAVIKAIHILLKNIISAICMNRSAYKLQDKDFVHSIGCTADNPYLFRGDVKTSLFGPQPKHRFQRTTKPTFDEAEQIAIEAMGQATQELSPPRQAANMYDLLKALQRNRMLIPSHAVYALCVERVLASLWHPDKDDIEQDEKFLKVVNSNQSVSLDAMCYD